MYAGFGSSFIYQFKLIANERKKIDKIINEAIIDSSVYVMYISFVVLTYKNKNRRIRLWVKMYKTLPVNGSITGSLWIRLVISIFIASNNDASGPMLTNGMTCALRTPE